MPRRDPAATARKWSDRLSSSTQEMTAGVMAVTEAPSQRAIAKEDTFRQRLNQAISEGRWREGLQRVTLQSWQDDMRTRGIPRAVEAARTALPRMETFLREFLPYAEQVSQEVRAMPNATDADREARMLMNVRRMREFRRRR